MTVIEAKTTDCDDGAYFVSLTPQQLGEHQLSLTIKGQSIHCTLFTVSVIASQDYTTLNKQVKTITGIITPWFIAIAGHSDMFVTGFTNEIYVFDSSRRQKTAIPSPSGPMGIAISGKIMYVVEHLGQMVQIVVNNYMIFQN